MFLHFSIPECLPEPADSSPDSPSPSFESIPSDETPPAGHTPTPPDDAPDQSTEEQKYSLRYCAEQVSHHPPGKYLITPQVVTL